jgi:predicted MFS family arabinose efflux permease
VQSVALRQAVTPPGILGRVNAAANVLFYAGIPLGGAVGGLLAGVLGDRAVVLGGAVLVFASVAVLGRPAVLTVRVVPPPEPVW